MEGLDNFKFIRMSFSVWVNKRWLTVLAHIQGDGKTVVHGLRNSDGNLSASHIEVEKLLPYYFGIPNTVAVWLVTASE